MKENESAFLPQTLDALRAELAAGMSERRYRHTLGVEKTAIRLGELYCPEEIPVLRAAALLHDLTKEESFQNQLQTCEKFGIILSPEDKRSPKILHAVTAAALIPEKYPALATERVINAVRWHTTGHADMTLTERLLYLADYIEAGRTFPDCVALREMFWNADPAAMSAKERTSHLRNVLICSFDRTICDLIAEKSPICIHTVRARNALLTEAETKD